MAHARLLVVSDHWRNVGMGFMPTHVASTLVLAMAANIYVYFDNYGRYDWACRARARWGEGEPEPSSSPFTPTLDQVRLGALLLRPPRPRPALDARAAEDVGGPLRRARSDEARRAGAGRGGTAGMLTVAVLTMAVLTMAVLTMDELTTDMLATYCSLVTTAILDYAARQRRGGVGGAPERRAGQPLGALAAPRGSGHHLQLAARAAAGALPRALRAPRGRTAPANAALARARLRRMCAIGAPRPWP